MDGTDAQEFGRLLRRFRRDAALSQEKLAELAGLSVRGLGDLERGVSRVPYRATVLQLAEALNLSPEEKVAFLAASRRPFPGTAKRCSTLIPITLTPLVGREREVQEVTRLLRGGTVRLLTLTGPGGVGKTRLALEVARRLDGTAKDGVCIVNLSALRDPHLVLGTIAETLGISKAPRKSVSDVLTGFLGERAVLLVLDNFEHLIDAAPSVTALLGACPGLQVLVTSRCRLRVDGEQEYPVDPLATPDPLHALSVQVLERYPAVQLFVQRAQAIQREFELRDTNALAIVEICARLDGLPLALELAAARTKLMPPAALARRLSDRLAILAGGGRDRVERHQTIRNTLDWSYSLLTTREQMLLGQLSVFAGGWDLDAAEAICNPEGQVDILHGLGSLLDHSLVRQDGTDEPRFSMLETLRVYAAEKLQSTGDSGRLMDHHAAHYVERAGQLGWQLAGSEVDRALAEFDLDHNNMRAALDWVVEQQRTEMALRLVHGLYGYWYLHGHLAEGWRWATRALTLPGITSSAVRANALKAAGTLAVKMQEYELAQCYFQESLCLFQQERDNGGEVDVLRQLGVIAGEVGNVEEGIRLLQRALDLSHANSNMWGVAACLDNLGSLHYNSKEPQKATRCFQESLRVATEAGIPGIAASAACSLGDQLAASRRWTDAKKHFEQALRLALPIRFIIYIAQALAGIAYCALHEKSYDRAVQLLAAASTLCERHDVPRRMLDEVLATPEVAHLQMRLSMERWSRLWTEGSQWSVDEAAGYGLADGCQSVFPARFEHRRVTMTGASTLATPR